jgi:N-acyl-D-amino-acid deacylase
VRDILIRGAEVVDGSGAERKRADLWLSEGRIAALAPEIKAPRAGIEVIDAGGLVAAPGFIDTHSHSDLMILANPDLPMKVRQGITLDVLGQDGISVAPVRDEDVEQVRRQLAGLLGNPDVPRDWRSVRQYLTELDRGAAINTAYLVPHGAVRTLAMGTAARAPSQAELGRMVAAVGVAMEEGALGLSTGLIYPPCCYAETEELVTLCREVARRRGVFVVHMRSESDRVLEALDEMLDVARRSGVHLHISHFKIAGQGNWPRVDALLDKVTAAQAEGLRVTADQYPYTAGSTMFGAILPPFAHDGGVSATLARLASPDERQRMRATILDPAPSAWDNFWRWTGPEGIVIADLPSGRRPEVVGKSVAAAAGGADPLEFAFDLLRDEEMGVAMISHSQGEAVVERILTQPYVNLCTDGLLGGRPHPRAYGSFPRLLARYVRERGLLTLEEAVRRMTSQAADAMHLAARGRLAVGQPADVVVFDPNRVADRATFDEPVAFPDGIDEVIVASVRVIAAGQATGARPGRTVRSGSSHESSQLG